MSQRLKGKKVAFLATDGFEQIELTEPWKAVEEAGGEPRLISIKQGRIQGMNHDEKADLFEVDALVGDVDAGDFDGLVLPGGLLNPDSLRMDERAVEFVRAFFEQSKPVAAICHGPWTLVEAGVVKGRTLTSWPSLQTDIRNAGGIWIDTDVHVEGSLVTSRNPDDLDAFCPRMVEAIEAFEPKHAGQHA